MKFVLVAWLCLMSFFADAAYIAPSTGNFDLTNWKLTLPVEDPSDGNALEIPKEDVANGYASKYFYLDDKGKMTFWTPTDISVATTANSSYPRTELREMLGATSAADWDWSGHHIMNACLWVSQTTGTGKVIVGQIHSTDQPLIKLQWENGNVYTLNKKRQDGVGGDTKVLLASPGTAKFCYTIDSNAGVLTVAVEGGGTSTYGYAAADPMWETETFYFKAGSYCQQTPTGTDTSVGCKVRFQSLSTTH